MAPHALSVGMAAAPPTEAAATKGMSGSAITHIHRARKITPSVSNALQKERRSLQ